MRLARVPPSVCCAAPLQVAADPLKFVDVRRCYDAHALLRTLDELLAAQAGGGGQGQQDGQQQGGEAVQQQQQQQAGVQDVQQPQDPGAQQGAGAAATAAAEGAAGGPRRRRLEDLPVALLIVDCLSALITPVLGGGAGQHSQGHALLAAAATSLKAVAAGPWKPGGCRLCGWPGRMGRPFTTCEHCCHCPATSSGAGHKSHGGRQRRSAAREAAGYGRELAQPGAHQVGR